MYKCEVCGLEYNQLKDLQLHLTKSHKMSIYQIEQYYIKYLKKNGEGLDPITGNPTEFISLQRGYKKFEKNNPKKLATNTVEHYMLKGLSLEDAQKRVEYTNKKSSEYLKKDWKRVKNEGVTRGGWSKKHFIELGFSEEEAEKEVKKRSKSREEKMKVYRENAKITGKYKMYTPVCIEYYINKGFSEDDAKNELKKRQATNTIESYIKRYGEIEGPIKFQERNKNWSKKMEDDYHSGKYTRDPHQHGNQTHCSSSNPEKELSLIIFDELKKQLDNFIYLSTVTGNYNQWFIFDNGRYYFFDIVFISSGVKKIIEFNEDYWHMNPEIYTFDSYNNSKMMTAQEIWDEFDKKIKIANQRGFDTYIVWESDWNKNKDEVIKNCINFLLYE